MNNMNDMNPYNCTIPGELFVGYDELRKEFLTGFQNGNSYTISGGLHCGKTSLLLQIEQDLRDHAKSLNAFRPLPRYLDITQFDLLTSAILFEAIYELVVEGSEAPAWIDGENGQEYETFLEHLDEATPLLDRKYGPNWVVVLLIDELDVALFDFPDDQFFWDLGDLLTESRFNDHFRIVATGMEDMSKLFPFNSSHLSNLHHRYLRVLTDEEIEELILAGFSDGINSKAEHRLLRFTGGHPYLLQGILKKIWQDGENVDESAVKRAKKKFLKQHNDFDYWVKYFGLLERFIYQSLIEGQDGTLSVQDLCHDLSPSLVTKIDGAITILSYHGVIDTSEPDAPQISGTMFRDWYQNHCVISNIQDVLKKFDALQNEVTELPVDDPTKEEVQEALNKWLEEQPTNEELTPSMETAVHALKKDDKTPEAISIYIEKLKELHAV